ncbi:hypothetical protein EJB05_28081, partial [Eragrostis curvula]
MDSTIVDEAVVDGMEIEELIGGAHQLELTKSCTLCISLTMIEHKVFFWLLLHDRVNTRGLLKRRNMHLDSYSSELCIWQREETLIHMFIRFNFAKAAWHRIGIALHLNTLQVVKFFKRKLAVPFFVDIIIVMCWSMWTTRNDCIFKQVDSTVDNCIQKFFRELKM